MSEDEDVKQLLGRAFTQEPPLAIDRDEVLQQGRKRLRRKRFFEAGSVVAAVVIAAVGATTLTNLNDEPDRLPPAASSTVPAPAGPSLPLSSDGESPPAPPTARTELPTPLDQVDTPKKLTEAIYTAGLLSKDDVHAPPGEPGTPTFVRYGEEYVLVADVVRQKLALAGSMKITIDFAPGVTVTCGDAPRPFLKCKLRGPVTVATMRDEDGSRIYASTVSRSGLRVTALVTNQTYEDQANGKQPSGDPALNEDEMCLLVSKAGLGAF